MPVELREVPRTVVGLPSQVRNVLINASKRGHLVSASPVRRVGRNAVRVDLVLREPVEAVRPAERPAEPRYARRRYTVVALLVVAATGVLVAIGVLLVALAHWVMAHLAVIIGVLVALAVLAGALRSKAGVCMGLHCSGCGH